MIYEGVKSGAISIFFTFIHKSGKCCTLKDNIQFKAYVDHNIVVKFNLAASIMHRQTSIQSIIFQQMDTKKEIPFLLAPALYVLNKHSKGRVGMLALFKTLYFADRYHLAKYGRQITKDSYIAMGNGPVPSRLYDYIKGVAGKNTVPIEEEFLEELKKYITVEYPYVIPLSLQDMAFLSRNQIESLEKGLEICQGKSFSELSEMSHDSAWHSAISNTEMSILEMAKAGGANEQMIRYINAVN